MIQVKKKIPDVALVAGSFTLFMLSRLYADRYAAQSGAAFRDLPVAPSPQHFHDLQNYAYSSILVLAVVCLFLKRWVAALVCLGFYVWAMFTDVTY
jgi:hypothetical protein